MQVYANSVDSDQTAPIGSTLFVEEASKTFQQMTKADNLRAKMQYRCSC